MDCPLVWGHLKTDAVFSEYRVESNHRNEIWIEWSGQDIAKVMKSTQQAVEVVLLVHYLYDLDSRQITKKG